jgi:signal peptidase II
MPDESKAVFGESFRLYYIENQGMAFGTTFGASIWSKLGLSVFRVIAIVGIGIYFFRLLKKGVRTELLIAIGLIFAGATGNLIDSMFYDFAFPYDPCNAFNHLPGSGNFTDCELFGIKTQIETRHTGFLFGNVVDMFQFTTEWPSWVPWYNKNPMHPSDNQIFPAIWNVADAAISSGVILIILRQRAYFPKVKPTDNISKETTAEASEQD